MKLLEKIKQENVSFTELAYKCGVETVTLRNWCNGTYSPNIIKEYKLAQALHTTIDEMNAILRETKGE